MEHKYKDVIVNYELYDNKAKVSLVFLHGWGQNIDMMKSLAKPFMKKHNVLLIDLPGFGKSDEPREKWTLYDYADMVNEIIKKHKLNNLILIGHSFGGKISICYADKYEVSKLVLLASPYRKSDKSKSLKSKALKALKKVPVLKMLEEPAKKFFGSTDYKNASPIMRSILVEHINTDLVDVVKKIKCPTLAIWGTNDQEVPYEDAVMLEQIMPNCGLVTYEGLTHYAYLENLNQTISVLNSFIGNDEK